MSTKISSKKTTAEIWKDIPGYEGRYQASNFGNIRSLNYRNQKGVVHNLRKRSDNRGYQTVHISNGEDKAVNKKVHYLVARAFLPNVFGYPCINHKDENKLNCAADNLEWCTYSYNNNYGTVKERIAATLRAIPDVTKKATEATKKKVYKLSLTGELLAKYDSASEAGRAEGIPRSSITGCCRRERNTSHGYIWEYV